MIRKLVLATFQRSGVKSVTSVYTRSEETAPGRLGCVLISAENPIVPLTGEASLKPSEHRVPLRVLYRIQKGVKALCYMLTNTATELQKEKRIQCERARLTLHQAERREEKHSWTRCYSEIINEQD